MINIEKTLIRSRLVGAGIITGERNVTVSETLQAIARDHGVTVGMLTGPQRHKHAAAARRDAYAALRLLGLTLPQIGRALGGRDHSTVLAGLRKRKEQCSAGGLLGGLGTDE